MRIKKIVSILAAVFVMVLFSNCTEGKKSFGNQELNDQSTMSILWFQRSAEFKALSYQAFNLAWLKLDQALAKAAPGEKLAVIADIDETLLDNSPWEAGLLDTGNSYPAGWIDWCNLARARPLPGSVRFLNYAFKKGVEIFYISNRQQEVFEKTLENLKNAGFPQAVPDHVLLRQANRDKQPRRQSVAKNHKIILLIGDSLNDFNSVFINNDPEQRDGLVDQFKLDFGHRFIVLPNPMYGFWESMLYKPGMTAAEKNLVRKKILLNLEKIKL